MDARMKSAAATLARLALSSRSKIWRARNLTLNTICFSDEKILEVTRQCQVRACPTCSAVSKWVGVSNGPSGAR